MKPENVKCPKCGGPMTPRNSKFGVFWGCSKFPVCKGTRDSEGRSKEERRNFILNGESDEPEKEGFE